MCKQITLSVALQVCLNIISAEHWKPATKTEQVVYFNVFPWSILSVKLLNVIIEYGKVELSFLSSRMY